MRNILFAAVLTVLMLPASLRAGTKEEIIRLQSDVLQLQSQIRMLQQTVDERNGLIISLLEQLNDQSAENSLTTKNLADVLNRREADVQTSIQGLQADFDRFSIQLDDTNTRIAALQQKLENSQLEVQSLRNIPQRADGSVEPDRVYFSAQTDYQMGNYELAVAGFQDFLVNHPDSELADNAAYYLGDSYQQQGRHEMAVQAFDQVIQLYPKGDKTPVAYYKKAVAYEALQRMDDAIATLKKLSQLYPNSPEALLAKEELENLGVN